MCATWMQSLFSHRFLILFDLLVLYLSSENASAICSWRCWNMYKRKQQYICIWKAELQRKLCSVCNVHTISCKHLITYVAIIVNVVTSTAPYTSSLPTTTLIMLLTCTCMFVGSFFLLLLCPCMILLSVRSPTFKRKASSNCRRKKCSNSNKETYITFWGSYTFNLSVFIHHTRLIL